MGDVGVKVGCYVGKCRSQLKYIFYVVIFSKNLPGSFGSLVDHLEKCFPEE